MKNKNELLNTQMNLLGLGGAFNGWFFRSWNMRQEQVMTLKEFIALNIVARTRNGSGQDIPESFLCSSDEEMSNRAYPGFKKGSTSWKKLKVFLLENKFSYKDWPMLLPEVETTQGKRPDYSLLDKKTLLLLPVYKVTGAKLASSPINDIGNELLNEKDPEKIKVSDIMKITSKDADTLSGEPQSIQKTLFNIQKKLKAYGFTEKDGPFMKAVWKKSYTEEDFVNELVHNKNFSRNDAITAVKFGVKAGWIIV